MSIIQIRPKNNTVLKSDGGAENEKLYIITGAAGHLGNTIIRMLRNMAVETRGLILPNEEVQEKETFGI